MQFSSQFGSHGMCENLYDVQYAPETKTMKVSKILNLENCTGKPRVFSNIHGVRCLNKSCNIDEVGPTLVCLFVCLSFRLYMPVCLSVCLYRSVCTCLSLCLYMPVCLSVCLYVPVCLYMSVCLSVHACLSVHVCLSVCLSVCTCLPVFLSVCLPVC